MFDLNLNFNFTFWNNYLAIHKKIKESARKEKRKKKSTQAQSMLHCIKLTCHVVRLSSKLLLHTLENGQMHRCTFLLTDYAFWSIFKTIKVLNYMEVITGAYLSKLFLSPVNSIVPKDGLYLWKEQWRDSVLLILSGNVAALNIPRGIIIMLKDYRELC